MDNIEVIEAGEEHSKLLKAISIQDKQYGLMKSARTFNFY